MQICVVSEDVLDLHLSTCPLCAHFHTLTLLLSIKIQCGSPVDLI